MRLREILEWSAQLAGCDSVPADSQVYLEAHDDVRRVLFGVDIGLGELLYAREAGFDAVIAHHPVGDRAQIDFSRVVWRQVEQMRAEGIPSNVAEAAVTQRIERPERALHIGNVNRVVDTARLIGIPLANIHLACDIITRQAIVDLFAARSEPSSAVSDAIEWLGGIPEIAAGYTRPQTWLGDPSYQLGRYTIAIAGGSNGGYPVFREYYRVGVDTVVAMHIGEEDLDKLRSDPVTQGCTLLVTGHMSADSIGINRVIAGLEERGVAVTRTSGVVAPSSRD